MNCDSFFFYKIAISEKDVGFVRGRLGEGGGCWKTWTDCLVSFVDRRNFT